MSGNIISMEARSERFSETRVREQLREYLQCGTETDPMDLCRRLAVNAKQASVNYMQAYGLEDYAVNYLQHTEADERRVVRLVPENSELDPTMQEVHKHRRERIMEVEDDQVNTFIRPRFFLRFQKAIEAAKDYVEQSPTDNRHAAFEGGMCYVYSHAILASLTIDLVNRGRDELLDQILTLGIQGYVANNEVYKNLGPDELEHYRLVAVQHRGAARIAYAHMVNGLVKTGRLSEDRAGHAMYSMIDNRFQIVYQALRLGVDVSAADTGLAKPLAQDECKGLVRGLGLLMANQLPEV